MRQNTVNTDSPTNDREWLFEDALSFIGIGKIHYFLILITGLIIAASITETMSLNIVMIAAECDLNLDSTDKGLLSSAAYVGTMLTSFFWGYLSDTKGRRNIMKWSLLAGSGASVLSSISVSFVMFLVIRFIVGVCLSASIGCAYPYLGEFIPVKYRQTVMSLSSSFIGLSMVYVPTMAWLILPSNAKFSFFGLFEYHPWRILVLIYAVPGLLGSIGLFYFPESPKYFMGQGLETKALETLQWIHSRNTGNTLEIRKLSTEVNKSEHQTNAFQMFTSQIIPIIKPPYIGYLLICTIIVFAAQLSSASLVLWFSEIENEISMSTVEGSMCRILSERLIENSTNGGTNCVEEITEDVYKEGMFLGVFYLVAYLLVASSMQFLGRRWIIIALFGSGMSGVTLFWISDPTLTLILFMSLIILSGVMVSVMTGAGVLLFPTNNRAMAVCIILTLGRLGTVFGVNFVGMYLNVNCEMTMGVLTGVVLLAGCVNFLLPGK